MRKLRNSLQFDDIDNEVEMINKVDLYKSYDHNDLNPQKYMSRLED